MSNMDVQEMQTRIDQLEAENARLRAEINVLRGNQTREQLHMSPLALPPAEPRPPSPMELSPPEARSLARAASPRPAGVGSLTEIAIARARLRHRPHRVNKIRANVEDAVNMFVIQGSTTQNNANEWVANQLNANQYRRERWLTELRSVLDERLRTHRGNESIEQVLLCLLAACHAAQAQSPPVGPANAANMLWRKAVRL